MFSHDENSSGYSSCDTKYGDIKDRAFTNPFSVSWSSYQGSIRTINIENKIKPTTMNSWFAFTNNCTSILGLDNINTSNVTDMRSVFTGCGVSTIDINSWDTSQVTAYDSAFLHCDNLTSLVYSNKFVRCNNATTSNMFNACFGNLNIPSWYGKKEAVYLSEINSYSDYISINPNKEEIFIDKLNLSGNISNSTAIYNLCSYGDGKNLQRESIVNKSKSSNEICLNIQYIDNNTRFLRFKNEISNISIDIYIRYK